MSARNLAGVVLLTLVTTVGAQTPKEKSDVALSWQNGVAYVPGQSFPVSPAEISSDKTYPVILYLHGCNGIGPTDKRWAPFLKELGFVVVQPDSLKRDRPIGCDPVARKGGMFPGVIKFRVAEVHYAREQIRKSSWADKNDVFLMGHSEGGVLAAITKRSDFKGVVLSGWHCSTTGLQIPPGIPVMAIDHESDPFYPGIPGGGCAKHFGDRGVATMITLSGHNHDTFEDIAKEAVTAFLRDQKVANSKVSNESTKQ